MLVSLTCSRSLMGALAAVSLTDDGFGATYPYVWQVRCSLTEDLHHLRVLLDAGQEWLHAMEASKGST